MRNGILVIASGPAGTGKGTVVKEICETKDDVSVSVSMTTRQPREGDVDGVNYYFTTRDDFQQRIKNGEFLEYNIFKGNNEYYGTLKCEVERLLDEGKDVILEIDVNGAMNVKKLFPNSVTVMILPPDLETLEARLRGRDSEKEHEILERLATAKLELQLLPEYDYAVVNEEGKAKECAETVYSIIRAERRKTIYTKSFLKNLK
ncbi:MAG: guanylate kinase [Clostridia bacterium]|nr:guanylate kinase [Clostridia bacterium]